MIVNISYSTLCCYWLLGPATIIEPDKKTTSYILNHFETLNKTCKARGNPSPEVQWWKGSDLIKSGNESDGIWIVINSADGNSFDNYSCVAKNWHSDYRFVLVKKGKKTLYPLKLLVVLTFLKKTIKDKNSFS